MGKLRLRETYLEKDLTLVQAGTLITPINVVDPIMDMFIHFYATNGATHNRMNYIFDVVENIEVVDGSDVLFSMKPKEILAMNAYHYKESLDWGITEIGGQTQHCVFKIPFGLGRYDPTIAFDPTQFKNPQLRVTWNLAAIRAVGDEGFADAAPHMDVIATIAERYPARPAGFLMHKHIHEWVTQTTGGLRIDMPVDYPHRTVFMRVDEVALGTASTPVACPWSVITDALYNVDEMKYVPFDWDTDDWMYWLKEFYGMWHQGENFNISGGAGMWRHSFLPANLAYAALLKGDQVTPLYETQNTLCKIVLDITASPATLPVHLKVDGTMPFNTWAYPFGDPDQMEEWLQVRDIGNIRLELSYGTAMEDHIAQCFISQYRSY